MSDFTFKIEGDATTADKAIGHVVDGLGKIPTAAARADAAVAAGLKQIEGWGKSATQSATAASAAFAKVGEALKREQDMLERIHGPTIRYTQDLQTLDALLHKRTISTEQYAAQVANLNRQMDGMPRQAAAPATPAAGPSIGSSLVGFVGAGALPAALLGAGHQVEELIHEHEALEDRYTALSNRALKFATDTRGVNVVIDEQARLASDLHAKVAPTIDLYDAVGDATDELGLSQRELMALTKTLGEGAILAGKPLEAAGGIMGRLSVAFAAGADGGRQMQAIMRDFPELGDSLAAAFHTDTAGVIELVESGKARLPELAQVWISSSEQIHDAMKLRKKTNEEERAEIQQTAEIAMNRGVPALLAQTEAGRKWDEAQRKIKDGWTTDARPVFNEIANKLQDQVKEWKRVEDSAAAAFRKGIVDGATAATAAIKKVNSAVVDIADALMSDGFFALAKVADPWFVKPETHQKADVVKQKLIDINRVVREGADAWDAAYKAQQRAMHEFDDPGGDKGLADLEKGYAERISVIEEAENDINTRARALIAENGERIRKANDDAAKAAEDAAKRSQEAWAQGLGEITGSFLEMARKGEMSFGAMVDKMLADLAILALKQAAVQMGGPYGAFLGAVVGSIGGHATGAQFMVGGAGGTDNNLVAFRATHNERVTVETPQQQRDGTFWGGRGEGNVSIVNQYQDDPRAIRQSMSGREGQRVIYNTMRRMPRGFAR